MCDHRRLMRLTSLILLAFFAAPRAASTHFHSDHDGGVPDLARLVPIRTFIDYGAPTEAGKNVAEPSASSTSGI
jgi:hypothetical protein